MKRQDFEKYLSATLVDKLEPGIIEKLFEIVQPANEIIIYKNKKKTKAERKKIYIDLLSEKYGKIIELKELLNENDVEKVVKYILKKNRIFEYENINMLSFFSLVKYIGEQFKELSEIEKKMLDVSYNDSNMPEYLKKQGYYNELNFLAGGDITKHNDILAMDYATILRQLNYMLLLKRAEYEELKKMRNNE